MAFFDRLKEKLMGSSDDLDMLKDNDEYPEVGADEGEGQTRVTVRPFVLQDFADTKPILDVIREGYTVALINIKPLKDQDLVELKRAISKLKKTCDAIQGDIAGFGDDWICITPSFAQIYRERKKAVSEIAPEEM